MIKTWREDLTLGILTVEELSEEFSDQTYFERVLKGIIKSVTPEFRRKCFSKNKGTTAAVINFPEIAREIVSLLYPQGVDKSS